MSISKKSTFFSTSLLEIDSEAEIVFNAHLENLDRVTNDIKTLEGRLGSSAIPFLFVYAFSSSTADFCESRIHEDHCLVWGKFESGGSRLLYNVYRTEEKFKLHDFEFEITENSVRIKCENPELKSSKPLVEMKALFRLNIEKELPSFYRKIIESLRLNPEREFILAFAESYSIVPSEIDKVDQRFRLLKNAKKINVPDGQDLLFF